MVEKSLLIAPIVATSIGLVAVPFVRHVALSCGFVDPPDHTRKLQTVPIALGGGVAVWCATWLGWRAGYLFASTEPGSSKADEWFYGGLLLCSFLILCLGILDDRVGLRARHKLAGQSLVAILLLGFGVNFDTVRCFGYEISLGVFSPLMTVAWVLLIVNAVNLLDGMDGFCGSIGVVAALAIAYLGYRAGRIEDAAIALALAGALAAFLGFNMPPAKIYLGDAGSMTVGLMLSVLSIRSCTTGPTAVVQLPPVLALLTLPLLDVLIAIGRRLLRGHSIFAPDRGHIHHCLKSRLGGVLPSLGAVVSLSMICAIGAILATTHPVGDPIACLAIATAVGLLLVTNTFGATESKLLLFRTLVALKPLSKRSRIDRNGIGQAFHLQGSHDWSAVWESVVSECASNGFDQLELRIELTAASELYYGHWSLPSMTEKDARWSIHHRLYIGKQPAGRIALSGDLSRSGDRYHEKVEQLVRLVESGLATSEAPNPVSETAPLASVNLSIKSAMT